MKLIGEFTANSQRDTLRADRRQYVATWEATPGYVEIPGITEFAARIDGEAGNAVLYMRWLVVDLTITGGKDATLDAIESHSPVGNDWAACLRANCEQCPPELMAAGAIALLALIASPPAYQGRGLGTPLARAFAQKVFAPLGVRAFWIEPMPLVEHAATGIFKPMHAADSPTMDQARDRLEKHYERSIDAKWTCPHYLRVDLDRAGDA
ncbi:MAG: hypothetical protein A3H93_17285 [Rhodocyclales bacterium RIFCSPLOWO2_02_FULL_63_24]|nr:MAG: hypothetical protein A3H93_17285 [Rhodocyclales bacterium RIFCSPLOWO2_02_FULL_63_24]